MEQGLARQDMAATHTTTRFGRRSAEMVTFASSRADGLPDAPAITAVKELAGPRWRWGWRC